MYHYQILSGPFIYRSFTMYMRKGTEEHHNVLVNGDLCYVSTVQTTGAQKGSSQNGTCACSTTHWPWPWVLKYSYLLSMSLAQKQLFLPLWNINLCSPRWYQLVAELVLPLHTKPSLSLEGSTSQVLVCVSSELKYLLIPAYPLHQEKQKEICSDVPNFVPPAVTPSPLLVLLQWPFTIKALC